MQINTLTLKNFKQYRDETILFNKGITGIVGKNGAGKSTIISAILFALYGVQGSGLNSNHIVSVLDDDGAGAEVTLAFEVGKDHYIITRKYNKTANASKHDAILYFNGTVMAKGVSDVAVAIPTIIGLSPQDFRNTIYAGQNDLLALIDSNPTARKEWFTRVLGIDYIKTQAMACLKEEIDALQVEYQRVIGRLGDIDKEACQQDARDATGELESSIANLMEQNVRLDATDKEIRSLTAQETNLRQIEKAHMSLTLMAGTIQERLENVNRDISELKVKQDNLITSMHGLRYESMITPTEFRDEITAKIHEIGEQLAQQTAIKKEFEDLHEQTSAVRSRIATNEAMIEQETRYIDEEQVKELIAQIEANADVRERKEAEEVKIREAEAQLGELLSSIAVYSASVERLHKNQDVIKRVGPAGTCPTCKRELDEMSYQTLLAELDDEIAQCVARQDEIRDRSETVEDTLRSLRMSYIDLNDQAEKQSHRITKLEYLRQKNRQHQDAVDQCRQMILDLTRARDEIDAQIDALEYDPEMAVRLTEEREICRDTLARLDRIHEVQEQLNHLYEEKSTALREKNSVEDQLAEIRYSPDDCRQVEADLASWRDARDAILAAINDLKLTIQAVEQRRDNAKEKIRLAESLQKEQASIGTEIEILTITRKMIGEFVIHLLSTIKNRLEEIVGTIVGNVTEGKYNEIMLDDDFNILVKSADGKFYPAERYSGGEKDVMAIALRIALGRYVSEINDVTDATFMIFDEIFGSQDEERQQSLVRMLRTQESVFPQIFIISHIGDVQGEFEQILLVEQEADLSSHIRAIET